MIEREKDVVVQLQLGASALMLADPSGEFHAQRGEWRLEVEASETHAVPLQVV